MKVTIAPDSLKESLSSALAAEAIADGVRRAAPDADVVLVPMADGGEGTAEAMASATGGALHHCTVRGPLGPTVDAAWGLCGDGRTAVVEMARASGLELIRPEERDPMRASTHGTGELIRAALDAGARRVIVGIGGSATVDGGTGMAQALGVRFLDSVGGAVEGCCGARLAEIADVDLGGLDPRIGDTEITIASDVTNPLVGADGAARVYGPQKGADAAQVEELERGLARLAGVIEARLGVRVADMPGAGAAGGLGAGLVAFLGARMASGVHTVMEAVRLADRMRGSDLVITAEGRLDGQSAFGKTIAGVAEVAAAQGIPVVALAGSVGPGAERIHDCGVSAVFCIADGPLTLQDAMDRAAQLLGRTAEAVTRLWLAGGSCDG